MPPMFDLKKYLAQAAHMETSELRDVVLNAKDVGAGLREYTLEIHKAGANIIGNYIGEGELNHLLAIVAGVSTRMMMESPDLDQNEKALAAMLMTTSPDFLRHITLSIMCAAIGVAAREEWR